MRQCTHVYHITWLSSECSAYPTFSLSDQHLCRPAEYVKETKIFTDYTSNTFIRLCDWQINQSSIIVLKSRLQQCDISAVYRHLTVVLKMLNLTTTIKSVLCRPHCKSRVHDLLKLIFFLFFVNMTHLKHKKRC